MGNFGTAELLLVLIAVLVLFGAKRLPTAARSLGQSMRIFKAETRALRSEDDVPPPAPLAAEQPPSTADAKP